MTLKELKRPGEAGREESGLLVVFGLESESLLESEFTQAKAGLLDWRQRRGPACGLVYFVFSGQPALHAFAEALFRDVYESETELAPLLQSVEVQVALLGEDGQPVKQFVLPPGGQRPSASSA